MEEFLSFLLTPRWAGYWIYAHGGGTADIQFILCHLIHKEEFRVDACYSGSSAHIVRVRRGRYTWLFLDSYFLLRDKLEAVGKWIGLPKLECAFDAPLDELTVYCKRDTEIVYWAVKQLEEPIVTGKRK